MAHRRALKLAWIAGLISTAPGCVLPERTQAGDQDRFLAQPSLSRPVVAQKLDRRLLAIALYHETNRVRAGQGLELCTWSDAAGRAADDQALICAARGLLLHSNPIRGKETAWERVKAYGVSPVAMAENLATASALDLGGREYFSVRAEDPGDTLKDPMTGQEYPPHSYASLSREILARWLASPEHRKNLLDPRFNQLGCAVRTAKGVSRRDIIFCGQVLMESDRTQSAQNEAAMAELRRNAEQTERAPIRPRR